MKKRILLFAVIAVFCGGFYTVAHEYAAETMGLLSAQTDAQAEPFSLSRQSRLPHASQRAVITRISRADDILPSGEQDDRQSRIRTGRGTKNGPSRGARTLSLTCIADHEGAYQNRLFFLNGPDQASSTPAGRVIITYIHNQDGKKDKTSVLQTGNQHC